MSFITDVASNPVVSVPLTTGVGLANLITALPILINIGMVIYIFMLIGHKGWVWYREWKGKQQIQDKDEMP